MQARHLATWMLEQEARALLTRLDRVKPFVLQETMLPAAALSPAAQTGIEQYLMRGRRELRGRIHGYIRWLRGPGGAASPEEIQRRFTFLRLQFNLALTQLDLFSDAITQRSESETGVWLSGLDVAAQDALALPGGYFDAPPIVCYLHRGLGGAIRRARTRLPGGGDNPVAIIRVPRERMIGYGIASSLVHEVGHQAAALLGLVESLRPPLQRRWRALGGGPAAQAWRLWERWISEIVADFWSVSRVGVSSTLGLIGVVSLPRAFVFRLNADDPHPFAWIRVKLSCAFGDALYPNPQWRQLAAVWESFYPARGLRPELVQVLGALQGSMPEFVQMVVNHRPPSLRGQTLGEAVRMPGRTPGRLLVRYRRWAANPGELRTASPSLAFAVLGQARAAGLLTPEKENRLLGNLITYWALRSTLDVNATMAQLPVPGGPAAPAGPAGVRWRAVPVTPGSPLIEPPPGGGGWPTVPPWQARPARSGPPTVPRPRPAQQARTGRSAIPRPRRAPIRPIRPRALGTRARTSA
jgi:hypothetical protein